MSFSNFLILKRALKCFIFRKVREKTATQKEINDIMKSLAIDMDAIIDSDIKIPSKIKSFFNYIVMVLL